MQLNHKQNTKSKAKLKKISIHELCFFKCFFATGGLRKPLLPFPLVNTLSLRVIVLSHGQIQSKTVPVTFHSLCVYAADSSPHCQESNFIRW